MNSLKNHLLISVPHMNDDIFGSSVIYICEHTLEGAMGLIINKPIDDISIKNLKNMNHINSDHFENLKIELYFGGPILVEKIIALHTNELKIENAIPLNNEYLISSGQEIIRNIDESLQTQLEIYTKPGLWKKSPSFMTSSLKQI